MNTNTDQANGFQTDSVPDPEGLHAPDLVSPVSQAASMLHPNQNSAVMPQTFPHPPQQMNSEGYHFHDNEMQSDFAVRNSGIYFQNHGVMSNFGSQQPTGGGYFHPGHQAPQSFAQQSNGPNFYGPGQAVINFGNYYYQNHGVMPSSSSQQGPVPRSAHQEHIVPHPNGHSSPAAKLWKSIEDSEIEASRAAKQAKKYRLMLDSLGSCPPPRALQANKRRLHKHDVGQRMSTPPGMHVSVFQHNGTFANASQQTRNGMPVARDFGSLEGVGSTSYHAEWAPAQGKDSSNFHVIQYNEGVRFEAPSTPDNFEHPHRISYPAKRKPPPKRQKRSGLQRNSTKPRPLPVAAFKPVLGSAASPSMSVSGLVPEPLMFSSGSNIPKPTPISSPAALAPMSASAPAEPSFMSSSSPPAQNSALPVIAQDLRLLLSSGPSDYATAPPPSISNAAPFNEHTTEISPKELAIRLLATASEVAPVPRLPPAQKQGSLEPSANTAAEAKVQEAFLPAGDIAVGPPVIGDGEFFPSNSEPLEGQSGPSKIQFPLEDAGYFAGFDPESTEWDFLMEDLSWMQQPPEL